MTRLYRRVVWSGGFHGDIGVRAHVETPGYPPPPLHRGTASACHWRRPCPPGLRYLAGPRTHPLCPLLRRYRLVAAHRPVRAILAPSASPTKMAAATLSRRSPTSRASLVASYKQQEPAPIRTDASIACSRAPPFRHLKNRT